MPLHSFATRKHVSVGANFLFLIFLSTQTSWITRVICRASIELGYVRYFFNQVVSKLSLFIISICQFSYLPFHFFFPSYILTGVFCSLLKCQTLRLSWVIACRVKHLWVSTFVLLLQYAARTVDITSRWDFLTNGGIEHLIPWFLIYYDSAMRFPLTFMKMQRPFFLTWYRVILWLAHMNSFESWLK